MKRTFKTADYDATLDVTIRLGDCLPPDHLARFVVDTIAHLDLSSIYARYGTRGGSPARNICWRGWSRPGSCSNWC